MAPDSSRWSWSDVKLLFTAGFVFGLMATLLGGAPLSAFEEHQPIALSLGSLVLAPLGWGALFALPGVLALVRQALRR